jgi:hypothetical protein
MAYCGCFIDWIISGCREDGGRGGGGGGGLVKGTNAGKRKKRE